MADDIVTQLRAGGRSRPEPLLCDMAADEIERLRQENADILASMPLIMAGVRNGMSRDIERLRAAGDRLASFIHVYMPHSGWTTADRDTAAAALDEWKEVRRD